MSLRSMTVQYIGDTLYLPPLERKVNHIIVRDGDVKDCDYFENKWTCEIKRLCDSDWSKCSVCYAELPPYPYCYCPNCGAKVVGE